MSTDLNIRIKAKLDTGVKRAIAGITADVKKSEKDRAKAAAKAEADKVKAAADAEKARQALNVRSVSNFRKAEMAKKVESITRSREILEDFKKAEKKKRDELAKTLREVEMSERRRAQLVRRTEREIARERGRARADAREMLAGDSSPRARATRAGRTAAAIGGGAIAVGMAGVNAATRLAGAGGVRSQEELLQLQIEFNSRLADLSTRSGIGADELRSRINSTATRNGVDQFELLDRLEGMSTRFGSDAVAGGVENLEAIARAAVGARVEMSALASATDTAAEIFDLSGDAAGRMSDFIVDIGDRGAIDAAELATQFAPFLGKFQRATGQGGEVGAQNALRFSALLGRGFTSASEAETMGSGVLRSLGDVATQERLALATGGRRVGRGRNARIEGGQRLTEDGSIGGRVVDPLEAIRAIMGNANLNRGQQQQIFGSSEAFMGADVLFSQSQTEAGQSILGASAGSGRALIERGLATQESVNGTGRDLDRARAAAFESFQQNSGNYARAVVDATEAVGQFTAANPLAADALTTVKEAALGLAGTFVALKVAAGGTAAGAAGGGALSAGAVAAAGGAAALGTAVAVPAALAAGGMTVDNREGIDMFDFWGEVFRTGSLTGGLSASGTDGQTRLAAERVAKTGGDEANTRATEANTRATEAAARAMETAARAIEAASRGGGDTGAETGVQ